MGNEAYISFDSFSKTGLVRHCFSTRKGGVSGGVFESMNLGLSRGDNRANVLENYRILSEAIGFSPKDMVYSHQVHGVEIRNVNESDKGSFPDNNHIKNTDGLITNYKGIVLVTFYADCVPLFFLDPAKKVIALSHAGWRGTVNGIGTLTVERMRHDYGCLPKDILAGIGPSVGGCCFEVDAPVTEEFLVKQSHTSAYIYKGSNNKSNIDLQEANKSILIHAGIMPENIEILKYCTKCRSDMFYSHRKMGNNRGSMAAFLELL